ncbi:cytochrome c oxidase subunit 7B [Xylocopa sonorina]|uniref:cytochrome c oxidase subunit 7B n=1 Tax=Xylocopa sonorina TaxID=1818115 RepID=UPI00403AD778
MLQHLLKPVIRNARSGMRSYHVPKELQLATMDEILVPSGSWKEAHDKAQRKYTLQFVAGVVILGATIAIGKMNGLLWLNYMPPKPKKTENSK